MPELTKEKAGRPEIALKELRTADGVAKMLNGVVGVRTIKDLAAAGVLPSYRIAGGKPLFLPDEVVAYIHAHLLEKNAGGAVVNLVPVLQRNVLSEKSELPEQLRFLHGKIMAVDIAGWERVSAVYFLCAEGRVVYVGQSRDVADRIRDHIGTKPFDAVFFIPCSVDELVSVESEYIELFAPALNGRGTFENRAFESAA